MKNTKQIASLITDIIDISSEQLLQQFTLSNENIYYESFRVFCEDNGIAIRYDEFIDLLESDQTYTFNEYSNRSGRYWVPALTEGYVSNVLPGDWDDFGDDQIEGITSPAMCDGDQQQVIDFEPLSNAQIGDEPDETPEIPDVEPEEPDLPDFDERVRHRPSRSTKELEGREPDTRLVESDELMPRLYGLVNSWQNGTMNQQAFEQELNKISSEPTLKNSPIDVWPMVHKIMEIRAQDKSFPSI
ncbi:MAG: hypothetical protein M0R50_05980 [Candidatus Cloacimonetes bacterium]|nr:hypothetical protein [Candidatus Cloacimonadota bacterium]